MLFKVINLDRTPQRMYLFKKANPNVKFERFSAIDGINVDRNELLNKKIVTESIKNRYTHGAIGVALSHKALWEESVLKNEPITIIEDDAYLISNFNEYVNLYTTNLPNWDFIFWGMNLDQHMILELSPGIATAQVNFDHNQVLSNIENISKQQIISSFYRCYWGVGLVCYSITPEIAQYLLENIFPLRDYFDFRDNFGIDNSIIEELPNMNSYACIPPIALTKNDRYNSTVQEN